MTTKKKFSKWTKWTEREKLEGIKFPGVYCIAVIENDSPKVNDDFDWIKEVTYIGMTNSINGLKSRLKQFDDTLNKKIRHGGADRFLYEHRNYDDTIKKMLVSVAYFKCDVKSKKPEDLITMGEVVKFEYVCFAEYVKRFDKLPKFNDTKKAKKYSLTDGRKKE